MGAFQPAITDAAGVSREHQVQVRLMQALAGAVASGENVARTLAQLSEYSRAHFLSEELLMRLYDYPDYDTHVLDHERMVERLDTLESDGRDTTAMAHVVQELSAVFMRHIGSCDASMHDFLSHLPS